MWPPTTLPFVIRITSLYLEGNSVQLTAGRSPAGRLLARPVQRLVSRPHDSADAQDRTQCLIHRSIRREGLSHFRVQEHEISPGAILRVGGGNNCQLSRDFRKPRLRILLRRKHLPRRHKRIAAAIKGRDDPAQRLDRAPPIHTRRGAVAVVQADDPAGVEMAHHMMSDFLRLPLPVMADHRPHHRRQRVFPKRCPEAQPTQAVRGAKQPRLPSSLLPDGALSPPDFLADSRRGTVQQPRVRVGMVADFVTHIPRLAGDRRQTLDVLPALEKCRPDRKRVEHLQHVRRRFTRPVVKGESELLAIPRPAPQARPRQGRGAPPEAVGQRRPTGCRATHTCLEQHSATIIPRKQNMENAAIAALLSQTADLMEIASEDPFRIRSYRNAAISIEAYPERVADLAADPAREVTEIKGIGKGLAFVLQEIIERGSFERRDQLLEKYPPTALELLKIQGLGPKSIALLHQHYRVSTVDDLERICREGKLRQLPRMGEKLEQKVLRSIESYKRNAGRFLVDFADGVAAEIAGYLAQTEGVEKVTAAGSLRRGKETIGDVDLLVTGRDPVPALARFIAFPRVTEVLAQGENKASAKVGQEGLQVDVRVLDRASYGSALQYFTGSKDHNVALRNRAIKMGFKLSEYGLFDAHDARLAGESEEEVYGRLDLDWIPPELRENTGEIEAAWEHRLPELVERRHIRGDLHMHTFATDGRNSIAEMAAAGRAAGYAYIAITDHSKALAMANGLDERRLIDQIRQIRHIASDFPDIAILAGCECDIRQDGRMDLDDEALAQLDLVIGSIHSYMNQEAPQMTDRLLRAMENPYLSILGHPTGRILLRRDAFPFDFERIAAEAARRKIRMEINSSPERLDLSANHLRVAKAKGVQFVISTDAHHVQHLGNIKYGVWTARRGWLRPADVINTGDLAGLGAALRRT